ncbi:hypothetical protein HDU99_009884 [Rhizoclosmatium hyalinum]|nr:hypothetical protein HDU99_009884 [Rhizoclosmatium hyalinum]
MEWPFSVTGITVLSYALHPHGRHLAVAVGGTEREPSLAITLANPKVDYIPDIEYRNTGKPPQHRKKLVGKEEQEKSADRVLRDVIKVTFWDIEGNCLVVTNAFHFPIFFDSADYTSVVGPYNTQNFMTRKNQFFLKWSHDGKTLCASDDCEIIKECQVEIKNNHVYGSIPSTGLKFGRKAYGPPVTNGSVQTVIDSKLYIEDSTIDLNVSAATAFSSIVYKKQEHTCIAYGDGIIGLRTVNLDRGGEEMRWYLGQKVFSRDGGDIVGCGYVPNVDSRSSMNLLQKQTKIMGVIVSARRNGTVVVQV